MALYGYHRDTMPEIGRFARSAVVFDNAVVSRGTTLPSYASMLTGLYPFHHGVFHNRLVLHESLVTLPEVLKSAGYHTAAFMSNFVLVGQLCGFDHGFDIYDDRVEERELNRPNYERTAPNTVKAILEWLASGPPQPFFLFTNFIDPHGPYHPPERLRRLYQSNQKRMLKKKQIPPYQLLEGSLNYFDYVDAYDGEIRYVDQSLELLIQQLKSQGLWDEALVIFTADHGEQFGEHGLFFEHQFHVWEASTRVPLMIRLPHTVENQDVVPPRRLHNVCSPMDFMPTILDYLRIPFRKKVDGRSLLPILMGQQQNERFFLEEFSDRCRPIRPDPNMHYSDIFAVRSSTHKLIRTLEFGTDKILRQAVFNITADPMEKRPMRYNKRLKQHSELAEQMDTILKKVRRYEIPFKVTYYTIPDSQRTDFIEQRKKDPKKIIKQLTEEQIESLRSLGYVD
jgi:arylsulfatase A-like enzyme